ncbi:conserved hypothetical protein [Ixodes scapularis]|uniref:Uncharacterized protein n=1 Tax=Ixodes scapularis TaxID=6945 RepID=B7PDB1_IXOSC|nr:conserved hypothetical protein [Ixodes scapularis]|eukprot:XP_002410711.1 conserved hypothetical protein [Ixodes scapularis]
MIDYLTQNVGRKGFQRKLGDGIDAGDWPERQDVLAVTKRQEDPLHAYLGRRDPGWDFYSPDRSTARTDEEELRERAFYSPGKLSARRIRRLVDVRTRSTTTSQALQSHDGGPDTDEIHRSVSDGVFNVSANATTNSTASAAAAHATVNASSNIEAIATVNGAANSTANSTANTATNTTVNARSNLAAKATTISSLIKTVASAITTQSENKSTHFQSFNKLDTVSAKTDLETKSNKYNTLSTVLIKNTAMATKKRSSTSRANLTIAVSETHTLVTKLYHNNDLSSQHTSSRSHKDATVANLTNSYPGHDANSTAGGTISKNTGPSSRFTSSTTKSTVSATTPASSTAMRANAKPSNSAKVPIEDITWSTVNIPKLVKRVVESTTSHIQPTKNKSDPTFGTREQPKSTTESTRSKRRLTKSTVLSTAGAKQPTGSSTTRETTSQTTKSTPRTSTKSTTQSTVGTTQSTSTTSSTESAKEPFQAVSLENEKVDNRNEDHAQFPTKKIQRENSSTTTQHLGIFDLFRKQNAAARYSRRRHNRRPHKLMRHEVPSPVPRAKKFTLFHARPMNAIRIAVRRDKHGLS